MEPELTTERLTNYELRLQGLYDELDWIANDLAVRGEATGFTLDQMGDSLDAEAVRAEVLGAKHRVHGAMLEISRTRGHKLRSAS